MIQEHRLIDAKKALRVICKECAMEFPNEPCEPTECFIRKAIEKTKTETYVEVVHGRWETDKEDIEWGNSLKRKHCTNCGKRPHFDKEKREFILSDFCPNCGAIMDGGEGNGET